MVTEEQTKAAYDRAAALDPRSPEGREAWAEYWGLAELRRDQLAAARDLYTPLRVVPRYEDTLTAMLDLFDAEDREREKSISTFRVILTDGF